MDAFPGLGRLLCDGTPQAPVPASVLVYMNSVIVHCCYLSTSVCRYAALLRACCCARCWAPILTQNSPFPEDHSPISPRLCMGTRSVSSSSLQSICCSHGKSFHHRSASSAGQCRDRIRPLIFSNAKVFFCFLQPQRTLISAFIGWDRLQTQISY